VIFGTYKLFMWIVKSLKKSCKFCLTKKTTR